MGFMLVCLATAGSVAGSLPGQGTNPMVAAQLDHVPIAVRDLDQATDRFAQLGFALEPGRLHPNSIVNAFMKFPDGTLLELITASEPSDSLARWYLDFLKQREGAAFVSFRTETIDAVIRHLESRSIGFEDTGPDSKGFRTVALDVDEPFRRLFFIQYLQRSDQTTAPVHPNTAVGLRSVWLAVADMAAATAWLENAGWSADAVLSFRPLNGLGQAFPMGLGALVLVAPTNLAGHTAGFVDAWGESIMGVTIEVKDVTLARDAIQRGTGRRFLINTIPGTARSLLVSPAFTHGVWLELIQSDEGGRDP